MSEEKIYQVALGMVPGIGHVTAKTLLSYCGSAPEIFKRNKGKLSKIPGIGTMAASAILNFRDFHLAEKKIEQSIAKGIKVLFITDDQYPKRLKHAVDSPVVLYYKGNGNLNAQKMVALVGTRRCTGYGKDMVEQLVSGLIGHRATIVSGLAYGIDIHAHKMALKNGLPTIAALASGLDIIYPDIHREIAIDMQTDGGLISENSVGTKPEAHFFPARNRIIAGMADAVIVVEAAAKGGALITAEIANSYNRDVFAVPGNIGNEHSLGCNNLIKQQKAHLITKIADLEYIMNWESNDGEVNKNAKVIDLEALSEEEKAVIVTIQESGNELPLDELSWKSHIPLNKLAALILNLEFKGLVKALPGKKYKVA